MPRAPGAGSSSRWRLCSPPPTARYSPACAPTASSRPWRARPSSPEEVVDRYAGRWSIEDTFRNVKQHLGGQEPEDLEGKGAEARRCFLAHPLLGCLALVHPDAWGKDIHHFRIAVALARNCRHRNLRTFKGGGSALFLRGALRAQGQGKLRKSTAHIGAKTGSRSV